MHPLAKEALAMDTPAAAIHVLTTTTSTNDVALLAAAQQAAHGTCWMAEEQTAGRGRREQGGQRRSWFSPPGVNIAMSLLLRPGLPPARASGLTLAAALGICEVLRERTGLEVGIKWPNDLYLHGRKLGGILTEGVTQGSHLSAVVVGVGINVNLAKADVPEELATIMTSLHIATGQTWDRLSLALAMRKAMLTWSERFASGGYEAVMPALRAFDTTVGRRVSLIHTGQRVLGEATGLGPEGELLVQLASGEQVRLGAGEVVFEPTT